MSWKQNYSKVRNASWIWYLLAAICFVMAVVGYHEDGGKFSPSFFIWIAACWGLAFSARKKRKVA